MVMTFGPKCMSFVKSRLNATCLSNCTRVHFGRYGMTCAKNMKFKSKGVILYFGFFPLSAKGHRCRRACTDPGFADERTEAPPVVPDDQDCIFEPSPNWESRGPAVHLGDCGPAVYNWLQRCTTALAFILSAFSPFPALFR